ncbi:hypothetical protein [Lederbergia lenta]|uniref:hypothetical protein n=1 Tax=Lederbergia lenta TaxID=1467 RepID=UPI00203B33E9|nr:hypothetical protein [Lederbergia lenta]MCM3112837.1 hypothetical protein [Lederbergia lenta]
MKQMIHEGKTPNDPEVQKHTEAMLSFMRPKVEPLLDDEAKKQLMDNKGSFEEPNPYLFPSAFNKKEEKFMERVMDELIRCKINFNRTNSRKL